MINVWGKRQKKEWRNAHTKSKQFGEILSFAFICLLNLNASWILQELQCIEHLKDFNDQKRYKPSQISSFQSSVLKIVINPKIKNSTMKW